jgi:nucleoid-associated protein YgaU
MKLTRVLIWGLVGYLLLPLAWAEDIDAIREAAEKLMGHSNTTELNTSSITPANTNLPKQYTVVAGDTLDKISQAIYGSRRFYKVIFEANRQQLPTDSMHFIREGMVLTIPSLPENATTTISH